MTGFRFFGLVGTWMEEDIIGESVANAFHQGCERVFVVDNASPDRTVDRAVSSGAVLAESYATESYDEPRRIGLMNEVMNRISAGEALGRVWWLWFDADEFPHGPGGRPLREHLTRLDDRCRVVGARYFDHLPTGPPYHVAERHPIEFQTVCFEHRSNQVRCPHRKHPLVRIDAGRPAVVLGEGFHHYECSEAVFESPASAFIHHFPYREPEATRRRMRRAVCDGRGRPGLADRGAGSPRGRALRRPQPLVGAVRPLRRRLRRPVGCRGGGLARPTQRSDRPRVVDRPAGLLRGRRLVSGFPADRDARSRRGRRARVRPTDLDRPARANRGVVFVGSAWFSGSTLLGVALGAHASIFYAGEAAKTRSFGDPTEPLKRRVCRTCGPGCPIWDDLTVAGDEDLYEVLARRTGRPIVFDSTKQIVWIKSQLEVLDGVVPVSLVVLTRDGRAVVNSRRRKLPDRSASELASFWMEQMRKVEELASAFPGRVHRVRYEELATRPEPTLRELAEFIGVPFDPVMLDPWRSEQHPLGGNDGPLLMLRRERDGRVLDGVITPDDETRDWYAGHPPAIVLDLRWRDELEAGRARRVRRGCRRGQHGLRVGAPTMILAIDQGTTGSTCLVFDLSGALVGRAYREFTQHFPRPGWVEHDAEEIWEVTRAVAGEALDDAGVGRGELSSVGIANQRETVVVWDPATGRPLHRALVWQDRRTADRCAELRAAGLEDLVRERTGLVLDPYFSATKIEWLLEHVDGLRERARDGRAVFGTIDSWIVFKLTGEHVTDPSNASRTLLFDIRRGVWDAELLDRFGVPERAMAELRPSIGPRGRTLRDALHGHEVEVCGVAGDQQAALFGQACLDEGMGKNTYGTGSFVLVNAGPAPPPPARGLLTTVAWGIGDRLAYALEASIFVTGAAVQWLRDGLGIIGEAAETEALAGSISSNDGVYFVPALTGLGSPHWDPHARGTIVGLTRGTGRAQLARATLEAIAYQTFDARQRDARGRVARAGRAAGRRWGERQRLADAVPGRHPRRSGRRPRAGGDDGARRGVDGRGGVGRVDARPGADRLARAEALRPGDGRIGPGGAARRLAGCRRTDDGRRRVTAMTGVTRPGRRRRRFR